MKAVRVHAYHSDPTIDEIPEPTLQGPLDVIVKIGGAGVCRTDLHIINGDWEAAQHPDLPYVIGHENAGWVHAVGEGVTNVKVGDTVILHPQPSCGMCLACRAGRDMQCDSAFFPGLSNNDGGMAEYMRLSARAIIHKIPETVSFEDAAVIEPLSCSIHAVNRGDIQFSDVVVIAGAGPLGLFMVQAAKLKTPKCLVVIDMADDRLELSKQFGADVVINPSREDSVKIVKEMTGGYGCDVYIEATGNPVGVNQGLQIIRKLGRFVEFSVFGKEATADWSIIGDRKELDVRGAHLGPYCYPIAIDLLSRGLVTSKGIAGVPRASLVVVAAVLPMFGLPEAGLLLVLGIDHFLDMGRTVTNVLGNAIATSVVAKWENAIDPVPDELAEADEALPVPDDPTIVAQPA